MAYEDFLQFFASVTVCEYRDGWTKNILVDLHGDSLGNGPFIARNQSPSSLLFGTFGILKLSIMADIEDSVSLCFHQVNARLVDETMLGSYNFAPVKVALIRIADEVDEKGELKLCFLEGDYFDGGSFSVGLESLRKGKYLVFYKFEWTKAHPVRRTAIHFHSPFQVTLNRIDEQ